MEKMVRRKMARGARAAVFARAFFAGTVFARAVFAGTAVLGGTAVFAGTVFARAVFAGTAVFGGTAVFAVAFGATAFAATADAGDAVKDLSGVWRVTGENLSGEVRLPGTLADAKLGRHVTAADWAALSSGSAKHGNPAKGALAREYQYRGKAVYEREIELTEEEAKYPLELVMERVMLYSELAIDGETVGSCDSLATEHVYPIPQRLTTPGRHAVRLTLDNSNRYNFSEWAHSYGPVMQSVWHGVVGEFALRRQSELRKARVFAPWPANGRLVVELPEVVSDCEFAGLEREETTASVQQQETCCRTLAVGSCGKDAGGTASVQQQGGGACGAGATCCSTLAVVSRRSSPYRKGFVLVELALDREPEPWSEHHPALYTLTLRDKAHDFSRKIRFGFRSVAAHDHALWVNGKKWFMRGNLDCCHFPLTGAPDTTLAWWRETFRRLRDEDGINSIRFHSWTPPRAAFDAADEMGLLIAVEAGIWVDRWNTDADRLGFGKPIDGFIQRELRRIVELRGNSPSFISLGIGNELGDYATHDYKAMGKWVKECKTFDPRRLYFASANQYHDRAGVLQRVSDADDYFTTGARKCRRRFIPRTDWDYTDEYLELKLPAVAHEIGQWPIYVDWPHELARYTGVMRPYNLERYRDVAVAAKSERFWKRYSAASAKLNRLMYKDEVESLMRTPSCAGLQLLSAQDFTGQYEAMIGWRDSFYDLKPSVVGLPAFRDIFNELPHLARFAKYCWAAGETYKATLVVRNLTEDCLPSGTEFKWSIDGGEGRVERVVRNTTTIAPGELGTVCEVALPLTDDMAGKKFMLRFGKNAWPFWVFGRTASVQQQGKCGAGETASVQQQGGGAGATRQPQIVETDSFGEAVAALAKGGRVLYTGKTAHCTKGYFKPVYWSSGHFKRANAELSSLGYCVRQDHPALRGFPTEDWADWQWYNLVEGGIKHGLAGSGGCGATALPSIEPIVMPVGDLHYSTLMGSLFELKVGEGRLMVCGLNLSDKTKPEVRAMRDSILTYMKSGDFNPAVSMDAGEFKAAFAVAE